jgi:Cell wall-active antibiotics response 4TMS YvqF
VTATRPSRAAVFRRPSQPLPVALFSAAVVLAALPQPAHAQRGQLRSIDVSRQLHDSAALRVEVRYGAGRLGVRAATVPVLYRMQLSYLADRAEPVYAYYPETRTLRVGVDRQRTRLPSDERQGELHLDLAPSVPVDLSLELGAVEADLDLSGLRVDALRVESGASDALVRFDTPNADRMRSLDLRVGAAGLRALRLGNANASEVRVQAGVGDVDLDFGGAWKQDVALSVQVALGSVRLHVPRDVGVRLEVDRLLASVDAGDLEKRGDAYYSDNWNRATRRLRITSKTTFGSLRFDRNARD